MTLFKSKKPPIERIKNLFLSKTAHLALQTTPQNDAILTPIAPSPVRQRHEQTTQYDKTTAAQRCLNAMKKR